MVDLGTLGGIELVEVAGSDLSVVNAARCSYDVEKNELDDKDIKLINYLAKHNHGTPFEHNFISFKIKCPMPIAVQWLRHRVGWSYNQKSARYTEFEEEGYIPTEFRAQALSNKQASVRGIELDQEAIREEYEKAMASSFDSYKKLIAMGLAKEQARMVMPAGFMTTFIASCNLRSFIHWYDLRSHEGAQYEIQEFAKAAIALIEPHFPHSIATFKEISKENT